jgi:hypothetical protein
MLGSRPFVLEDGRELSVVAGPHAEEEWEVLEGMYADGCALIEESKISAHSGRERGQVSAAGVRLGPAGIVSKDLWTVPK